jgi:predicted nucleic acid-binding protein
VAQVILVDTNAWIDHLRAPDPHLVVFLRAGRVRTSDVVIGELLLGSGLPRGFAKDLMALPRVPTPTAPATRTFIERHKRSFAGSGVGWADAQIIHTAATVGLRVHTSDGSVRRVCKSVAVRLA